MVQPMIFRVDRTAMRPELVAERLEALIAATGLQPMDFADQVEIDRSSFSKIRKGKKPLSSEMAFRISERFEVPMDFIYKGRLVNLPDRYEAAIIANLKQGQR